jgi:hypothetical protein
MTTPFERTRALVQTKNFLLRLSVLGAEVVPRAIAVEAEALLRHYPDFTHLELAHQALPMFFGPVPPFSRMSGTADVRGAIKK